MEDLKELMTKMEEVAGKIDEAAKAGQSVAELEKKMNAMSEQYTALKQEMSEIRVAKSNKKGSVPGLEEEAKKFSLMRAINAIATKNWKNAEFEREVFLHTSEVNKDMSTETDTAGGYVVPTQVLSDFVELLRANLIVRQLGATYIDGLMGSPVEMPGQAGGATIYWLGEDNPTGITSSDLSLKQNQMTPHMAAALVKLSNRLLRMSNPGIEGLIRQDVSLAMADAIDQAVLVGAGANGQPLGLLNVPGILTHDLSSVTAKPGIWAELYELENKLAEANSLRGKLGFAWHPRVKKMLSQARIDAVSAADEAGAFVANPLTSSQLASYVGYPFASTTNLPITSGSPDSCSVLFGNWAEMIVGTWQGITIMASQEADTAFAKNQTWVRIITEVDCMVRHPESFCHGFTLDATL